jgi:hypothetical protein
MDKYHRMDDEHMGSLRALLKYKRHIDEDCHITVMSPDSELMLKLLDDTHPLRVSTKAKAMVWC